MRRLLLVTHRSIDQEGGPSARWRSLARHLPEHGWSVDTVSAPSRPSAVEFSTDASGRRRVASRAMLMSRVRRAADPAFAGLGVRADAVPLSMAWIPRGALAVRRRVRATRPDAVMATGPPIAGLLAARIALSRAGDPPLMVELRDLWAGSPAFDRGGAALGRVEDWVLTGAQAIVACTGEAAEDLRRRHPAASGRVHEIPNGFEPELLGLRNGSPVPPSGVPRTILHSGTLTAGRPLEPLLRVLARPGMRERFRLVLHGYLAPESRGELAAHPAAAVEVLPPGPWEEAVRQIGAADVALVTQARGAGDDTAVASKVYEYLALGRPVLAITDGGATERLLRRLGAGELCARLDDDASIVAALDRVERSPPEPLPPAVLEPFDRSSIAARMARLLDGLTA